MDINDLRAELKSGNISGVYILAGEEDYLVRHYLSAIREAMNIDEALAVFNNPCYEGAEIDCPLILEAAKAAPMMSDKKLVEWRRADFSNMREGALEEFEELVEELKNYPYSAVVFTAGGDGLDFGTPKRPSAFVKRFGGLCKLLRFERSSDNQLYAWLKKHFESWGVSVGLDTVRALVFRSGHSMSVLASEVEKLSAMVLMRGKNTVTPEDVEEIASSTPECDTFALSNAILDRNKALAYDALAEMKIRRVDPTVIMGMIAKTFGELSAVAFLLDDGIGADRINDTLKMNEYKLKIYLSAAKRYGPEAIAEILANFTRRDVGSKYGGVTGYTAVELFIAQNL